MNRCIAFLRPYLDSPAKTMVFFDITVYVRPNSDFNAIEETLDGERLETLSVHSQSLNLPFPVSFEEASAALQQLPRLFLEPDGSWVWVGVKADGSTWQVDGQLVDRQERLIYVNLRGECPEEQFDQLLQAFGWPTVELLFQLRRPAVLVAENPFRHWARRIHHQ